MPAQIPSTSASLEAALTEIAELRRWTGPAKEFWPRFLMALAGLTNPAKVVILLQDNSQRGKCGGATNNQFSTGDFGIHAAELTTGVARTRMGMRRCP